MPASTGLSRTAEAISTGWDHVVQSIGVILTTPIGSRLMRREFGSEIPELIDRPMTDATILAVYAAAVNALRRWEPRFRLTRCQIQLATATGELSLEIVGAYMPRGHLGDYTVANDNAVGIVQLGTLAA